MKILIQFAFASACLLGVHVCDSSAADRYSRTSDFSYWHAPAITPTKVERPVFGPHMLTFDSFSEDDQELEFLMWLGVEPSCGRGKSPMRQCPFRPAGLYTATRK